MEEMYEKKRIAALLLTAFLIVNEAVYPVDQYVIYAQSEPEEELNMEEGEMEEYHWEPGQ